jgi:triosephosphate isomerase
MSDSKKAESSPGSAMVPGMAAQGNGQGNGQGKERGNERGVDSAGPGRARRPLVIGNWKMNGSLAANERLLGALRSRIDDALLEQVEVAVCPPFAYISQTGTWLGETGIGWGAQNVARQDDGAFTGEVSARMLADLGCRWVLIGHSERRQLFGENDEFVALKVSQAQAHGLRPVICLGETLEERQAEVTEQVLGRQLDAVLPVLAGDPADYVLAYEPVWAIGTGLTATPAQAQAVHAFLRSRLAQAGLDAHKIRILYGGSMKAGNAGDLLEQVDVDGGLIGGAALVPDDFVAICKAAAMAAAKSPVADGGGKQTRMGT